MKKTVLTFGLISGAMMAAMMLATVPFVHRIGFAKGMIVGYTTMVVAFLMVFFGIRSYRDNLGQGKITFGKGFSVGILITLITSIFYVATWLFIYYQLMPDFCDRMIQYTIESAKASGVSQQMLDEQIRELNGLKAMLANPFINAALTFIEPFPVGLIITLVSAAILRKK
jgi:hypothetical protein